MKWQASACGLYLATDTLHCVNKMILSDLVTDLLMVVNQATKLTSSSSQLNEICSCDMIKLKQIVHFVLDNNNSLEVLS
jgi:hypothetical protein